MLNLEQYAAYANMKANAGEEKYYPQANGEMHYVYGENLDKYKKDPTNPEYYRVLSYKNWQKEAIHLLSLKSILHRSAEDRMQ